MVVRKFPVLAAVAMAIALVVLLCVSSFPSTLVLSPKRASALGSTDIGHNYHNRIPAAVVKDASTNFITPYGAGGLEIRTDNATDVTSGSAQLNGTLVSLGTGLSANVSFQWGPASGKVSNETTAQVMSNPGPFYADLDSLSANTTYYFRTKAVGQGTDYGLQLTFTTLPSPDTTPPAAVSDLATSNVTSNSMTLTWTAPGDDGSAGTAATYDLRYSTTGPITTDAEFTAAIQVVGEPAPKSGGSAESFLVSGLSSNTTYYFALKTADEVPNWSAISNSPSGTTLPAPDTTPPAAVSDLATSNVTSNSMTLTWTAPGDDGSAGIAATYDLRYSTSLINDANWSTAAQIAGVPPPKPAGSSENFTVTSLSANTTYYFALKTADEVPNSSALSNSPSGTTLPAPDTTPPTAVSDLAASSPTQTSITLTWTAPGDDGSTGIATTYDLRYSTTGPIATDAEFTAAIEVVGEPAPKSGGSAESFLVSGLSPNTTYYFALKTADEVPNWSSLSNCPSGTTSSPDTTPPAAVTDLATSSPTQTSITLTWTAPGDDGSTGIATTYDLRYSTSLINDANWSTAAQIAGVPAPKPAGSSENFTVTSLSANTTYYFALKTADEVPNWSSLSNSPSGTTLPSPDTTPPAAVTDLATSNVTSNSITLTWTAPGDDGSAGTAATYDLRYSTAGPIAAEAAFLAATQVVGEPAPKSGGSAESFLVSGLSSNTTYYFALKTADEVPNSSAISNSPSGTTLPSRSCRCRSVPTMPATSQLTRSASRVL